MNCKLRIINMIESDEYRMRALQAASSLNLPDWLIAAGFIRNMIWNNIFDVNENVTDIDVVYFCPQDNSENRDQILEEKLRALEPEMPWSVKNQARMHVRNGDAPYKNTVDAMSYWPEKQTAIGARLYNGEIMVRHCFDLEPQFNGKITHNSVKPIALFNDRIRERKWLTTWPLLQINY
ncbi:hypothetical protein AB833_02165 [Chromatiales bacterium (ex Bugula neritina AB1)]|nr:hypothetical protein AB833_02165 [Chromatiales bacterium (ex Bugula neritina AB1)]